MTWDPHTWPNMLITAIWIVLALVGWKIPIIKKAFNLERDRFNIVSWLCIAFAISSLLKYRVVADFLGSGPTEVLWFFYALISAGWDAAMQAVANW